MNGAPPSAGPGPVIVVTGGASGLGRAVAEAAVSSGRQVVVMDSSDQVQAVGRELGAQAHHVDVRDEASVRRAFEAVAAKRGPVAGLVNCAGLTRPGPSDSLSSADWRLVVDVNLSGTFYCCQAAFTYAAPQASFVNLASVGAVRGLPERAAYTASKAGVVGLTRALATEWARAGVRVNAVGPSWVDTPLIREMVARGALDGDELAGRVPLGRLCTEDDVVKSVMFLLDGETSGFVTGQTLYLDGGYLWAGR